MKFRMFSVALIGPDGAGKSTISRALVASSPFLFKTIYMGDNIEACNFALPTSRLVGYFRRRRNRNAERSGAAGESSTTSASRKVSLGQMVWTAGRLANFLAEEWYRQLLSWTYQALGYIVLCDRHFLFDFSLDFARKGEKSPEELENRRQAFLRQGTQVRNFVRVDGTQPLDKVCAEVCKLIAEYSGRPSTSNAFASL